MSAYGFGVCLRFRYLLTVSVFGFYFGLLYFIFYRSKSKKLNHISSACDTGLYDFLTRGRTIGMSANTMPEIYLITEATAGVCVAIICAIGCESNALGREHGENAQIEPMHSGWTVHSGEARGVRR